MISGSSRGVVLLCGPDGLILDVIVNSGEVDFSEGRHFCEFNDDASRDKCSRFLAEIRIRKAALDWELNFETASAPQLMDFAGSRVEDSILLIGSTHRADIERLCVELLGKGDEVLQRLVSLVNDCILKAPTAIRTDQSIREEMTQLNNDLIVAQRELTKKNVQLEMLNQQKNQFLGMAAHDLRSALGVTEAYSDFLIEDLADALNPHRLEFLQTIKSSSKFMLNLVNDLLDISLIESGHLELTLEPLDLSELVTRNVSTNRVLSGRKNIDILLEIEDGMRPVLLDGFRIEQVLNNLLSNAIKYSNEGTTVRVGLALRDGDITLSVKDEGQGIPAAEIANLFQPFKKTSARTTAGESSTGLGLLICRKVVEGHEGRIWAESEVGRGTTLFVVLPMNEGKLIPEKAADVDGEREPVRSARVLIVDDEQINLKLTSRLVEKMGHEVSSAVNGREAIAMVEEAAFDIVLMDVEMPVMDGLQAAAFLRVSAKHLPVVALTAHLSDHEQKKCLDAGMVAVISKPIKVEELERVISEHLKGS